MDEPPTRGEVIEMFRAMTPQLLGAVFEVLGISIPAEAAAEKRRRQLDQGVDDQFLAARKVVLSRPYASLGDLGHRIDDGIHAIPLNKSSDPERDESTLGPASRAIARRKRAREET